MCPHDWAFGRQLWVALVLACAAPTAVCADVTCPAGQYWFCTQLSEYWGAGSYTCASFAVEVSSTLNAACEMYGNACSNCCECGNKCTQLQGGCGLCPRGKYKTTASLATTCTSCYPGTITSVSGATACESCPAGFYSLAGSSACEACPAGSTTAVGFSACSLCSKGTYSAGAGQACAYCDAGKSTCTNGSTSCDAATCTPCAAGKYSAVSPTGSECGPCAGDVASCKPCPSGTTSLAGSSYCVPVAQAVCGVGQVRDVCSSYSFTSALGYYCSAYSYGIANSRNDKCVEDGACWACCQCADFCRGQCASGCATHLANCVNVYAGYYKNTVGDQGSVACPPGSWSAAGASACTACVLGTYASDYFRTTCFSCVAPLSTCLIGSASCDATCTTCVAGKFGPLGSGCGPCAAGGTTCEACQAGKYAPTTSATVCLTCATGTTCAAGQSACGFGCNNAGYTGADSLCTGCPACAAGKFKATRGTMGCTDCAGGKYLTITGGSACVSCPASTPSSQGGSSSAAACARHCPAGTWGTWDGIGACTACPTGKSSPHGISSVTGCTWLCPAGQSGENGVECTLCGAGKFKSSDGSQPCTLCFGGSYSATVGAVSYATCLACDPTSSWNMETAAWPLGMYWINSVPYDGSGVAISTGNVFPTSGGTKISDCVCGAGHYKATETAGAWGMPCTLCPVGKYKTSWVFECPSCRDKCLDCPVGKYQNYEGSDQCFSCNSGYGTCSTASVTCVALKTCAAGWTGADSYCDTCAACAAGTFKAVIGSGSCGTCGVGTVSAAGASACAACPAGKFANSESSACAACAAGTWSGTGASACTACGSGASSPAGSTASAACTCQKGWGSTSS